MYQFPEVFYTGEYGEDNKVMAQTWEEASKGGVLFRTSSGTDVYPGVVVEGYGRVFWSVWFRNVALEKAGKVSGPWYQLFYKSSGKATPGLSPKGTVWPCGPFLTDNCFGDGAEEILKKHKLFFPDMFPGWIIKSFFIPEAGNERWELHNKKKDRIPKGLLEVCSFFENL